MSIDVRTIICEDLSHKIWTILNDTAVDIPAMMEWVGRAQMCYCTCRQWVVYVIDRSHVSSTGSMCHWRGVYVVVVTIATHRHLLHHYPSLWGLKSLVGSIKFISWVEGEKMGENGPRNLLWPIFVMYFMGLPVLHHIFPSPITLLSENDPLTSLWKGVWLVSILHLWGVGPISLKGEEGLQVRWMCSSFWAKFHIVCSQKLLSRFHGNQEKKRSMGLIS